MEIEQELRDIINQTKVNTQTLPMGKITLENPESNAFVINFNVVQYFTALQSLNELFVKYCIEERGAGSDTNKVFLKFTYLVQIHLTRLCHYANLNPQNIKYNCFELGIFYVVLLKLANEYHFQELLKSLLKLQEIIFITQKNNKLTMITITMAAFESHYLNEINLYQQHFGIHLSSTTSGKVTFITNIAEALKHKGARKLLEIYQNAKFDLYQVQLAFKLIEYLYLESIFVEFTTRVIRGKFLTEVIQLRNQILRNNRKLSCYLGIINLLYYMS